MLLLLQVSEPKPPVDDRRVTYILDQDLVRFGKFAGAVLAVFITVGATFMVSRCRKGWRRLRGFRLRLRTFETRRGMIYKLSNQRSKLSTTT
jgi:hypothetical protein